MDKQYGFAFYQLNLNLRILFQSLTPIIFWTLNKLIEIQHRTNWFDLNFSEKKNV